MIYNIRTTYTIIIILNYRYTLFNSRLLQHFHHLCSLNTLSITFELSSLIPIDFILFITYWLYTITSHTLNHETLWYSTSILPQYLDVIIYKFNFIIMFICLPKLLNIIFIYQHSLLILIFFIYFYQVWFININTLWLVHTLYLWL